MSAYLGRKLRKLGQRQELVDPTEDVSESIGLAFLPEDPPGGEGCLVGSEEAVMTPKRRARLKKSFPRGIGHPWDDWKALLSHPSSIALIEALFCQPAYLTFFAVLSAFVLGTNGEPPLLPILITLVTPTKVTSVSTSSGSSSWPSSSTGQPIGWSNESFRRLCMIQESTVRTYARR